MPSVFLNAFVLGAATSVVAFTGSSVFASAGDHPEIDRVAYKEESRNRFRRPVNETINEIGEGRGMSKASIHDVHNDSHVHRYLWTRLCRETETATEGELRH